MRVNVARTLARSAVNGPGERFVVWVQGCPLACPGCWNQDTWSFSPRTVREASELAGEILGTPDIEGVTFTGGEPFAQARALAEVGRAAREAGLSVFVFTGYDLKELTSDASRALLAVTDVLAAGRYIEAERSEGLAWRGSSNQEIHFLTSRYGQADMSVVPEVEIRLGPDGDVTVTGYPPDGLRPEDLASPLSERQLSTIDPQLGSAGSRASIPP